MIGKILIDYGLTESGMHEFLERKNKREFIHISFGFFLLNIMKNF